MCVLQLQPQLYELVVDVDVDGTTVEIVVLVVVDVVVIVCGDNSCMGNDADDIGVVVDTCCCCWL